METKLDKVINSLKPIEIPKDFKELITLQPLITQIEVFKLLKENLDDYCWSYFMSQRKTVAQVLSTIPEKQWATYLKNTFDTSDIQFRDAETTGQTLPEILKTKYTICNQYLAFTEIKHREAYFDEEQDIIIDYKKKKFYFVVTDICHGNKGYSLKPKYNLKDTIFTVEYKWSYVPWYNNSAEPIYFSHYYKFDLSKDCVISVDTSRHKS